MKPLTLIIGALIANGLIASNSWAQTSKELDITMSIAEESDSPSAIINRIELPPVSAFIAPVTTETPTSAAVTTATDATNALDQVQDDLQNVTGDVLDTTNEVLTNTINDVIGTGDLEQLPGDIIDQLPELLPDDLLPNPGDVIPNPGDLPLDAPIDLPLDKPLDLPVTTPLGNSDSAPNVEDAMNSVLDNLEREQPSTLEQIPEPNLPLPEVEPLLNDIPDPLKP